MLPDTLMSKNTIILYPLFRDRKAFIDNQRTPQDFAYRLGHNSFLNNTFGSLLLKWFVVTGTPSIDESPGSIEKPMR